MAAEAGPADKGRSRAEEVYEEGEESEVVADENPDKKKLGPRRPGGLIDRGKVKGSKSARKWLLRIFRGYDANGKRIYYSETYIGKADEANERLIELRNNHRAGRPLKFKVMTFKDFFDKWVEDLDDGKRRECTIEKYREVGSYYLIPAFGKFALTDITDTAILRLYRDMRAQKYAPSTIRLAHVVLSSALKAAEGDGLLPHNPMAKIKKQKKAPALPKAKPVAMTADETQKFLDAASARPEGFMFRLAYFLGARPCEYLGLQWGDVDFKAQRITIQRSLKLRRGGEFYTTPPKTEESVRTITLTPAFVKGLEDHRRSQRLTGKGWKDADFIFTDDAGDPLKIYAVRAAHKEICKAAGLPDTFKLKVSRHSCASALLNDGVPLKMVSDRLGHASVAITADVYSVTDKDRQREVSERLEQLFGTGKK